MISVMKPPPQHYQHHCRDCRAIVLYELSDLTLSDTAKSAIEAYRVLKCNGPDPGPCNVICPACGASNEATRDAYFRRLIASPEAVQAAADRAAEALDQALDACEPQWADDEPQWTPTDAPYLIKLNLDGPKIYRNGPERPKP